MAHVDACALLQPRSKAKVEQLIRNQQGYYDPTSRTFETLEARCTSGARPALRSVRAIHHPINRSPTVCNATITMPHGVGQWLIADSAVSRV